MQPLDEFKALFCQILFDLWLASPASYYDFIDSEKDDEPQKEYRAKLQELGAYIGTRYKLTPDQVYKMYTEMIDEMLRLYVVDVLFTNIEHETTANGVQKIVSDTIDQKPGIDPILQ